jgi:hypothetical protein
MPIFSYSLRKQSTRSTNLESTCVHVDELVKEKSKQNEDHSSSLAMCEVPELPVRGYLQDADFMKREFSVYAPGTFSMNSEQPATFSDQGENSTANQLTWQHKSDYMTLVRRPEDSENSDYTTLLGRSKKADSMSLTYHRDMPSPSAPGKLNEGFHNNIGNTYKPLDLSKMKNSSTYQKLHSQFMKTRQIS